MSWNLSKKAHLGRHPVPGLAMRAGGRRLMRNVEPEVLASDLRASASYAGALEAAAAVECPTLLILGEHDLMTPMRNATSLIEALRNETTVTLPEVGHMMMQEDPDTVLDAMLAFLGSLTPSE